MELAQLQMVKHILETGSLSKTAMRLNWAQSVVSRQLAALERECGGRIFYRNGRGVLLTELGEKIIPQIDLIISAAQEMVERGEQLRNDFAGEVRVAVSPQVAPFLSGPLFSELKQNHPNIRLNVSDAFNTAIKSDIQEGRIDIAVFMRSGPSVSHDDRVVCELESYVVGLPDSPATANETIAFSDLAGLPLLLPSRPNAWRRSLDDVAASKGMTLSIAAEVNAPGPTAALLYEGAGYLISPLASGAAAARMGWIGADVHAKRLRASRIVDPKFTGKLVIITGATRHRRVDAVVRMIESILKDLTSPDTDDVTPAPPRTKPAAPKAPRPKAARRS